MADFTTHQPGTFTWAELSTSDQQAGVRFYRSLFGWDLHEAPMGPGQVYAMFQMRGRTVAAAAAQRPEERQAGVPPHWNMYVTVANADDAVKKAASLGGRVLAPAFDVMDAGRMAVLQDPTGAVFQVWQVGRSIGAMILNEPGSLCWTELTTSDTAAAETFYTGLFGWTAKRSGAGTPFEYTEFSVGGVPSIGMMPKPAQMPPNVPSYWMPYFQVADVDASTARARELGAQVMVGPQDIPNTGRFSVVGDPQGAVFAIFQRA